ncbi:tyrosine-type recombinase/integrase [Priestia megaterium]|uniref:tyrosine-type recombinase/integrase n=1 Tax=Priestia megaterium TaxID=1404 RepID=UPI001BECE992|nr:tyrosine-type recombinase/integrase [Priestia megaterium]MBT2254813.1 type I restriction enzyme HsdR N-terminal domain-containing protein [Priestia megaterium]
MQKIEWDLEFIKEMYQKYEGTNEANIQQNVVVNFLKMLGYDSSDFSYEHSKQFKDGRADIAVKVKKDSYLYVEVKESNNKLDGRAHSQLIKYIIDGSHEWGLLTNGRKYILINEKIEGTALDKVVFNIDIFNKKDTELLKYLRKENLFDVPITNYFKEIAQFKAIKYPNGGSSWNNYKSTLYNFFKYYSTNLKRYRELSLIRVEEFEDFLQHEMEMKNNKDSGRKIVSIDTFDNKYSHIRSFFHTLNIRSNGFDEEKVQLIRRMNLKEEIVESNELLTEENIELILNFYSNRRDSIRNKALILLCLSFGLERSTILSLTINSIKKDKLIIGNRELVMPKKLQLILEELKEQHKLNKVKDDCLFFTKYNNDYKPLSESTINYIFDTVSEIDKSNLNWKKLSTAYIRSTLIKKLFDNNFSLEEIVYLTGADLSSLSNLIPIDEIINNVKTRKKNYKKVHPFYQFLN